MNHYLIIQPGGPGTKLRSQLLPSAAPRATKPVIESGAPPSDEEMQAAWDAFEHPPVVLSPRAQLQAAHVHGIALPLGAGTIQLAAADKDRNAFTQMLTLLREAEDLQPSEEAKAAFRASNFPITDAEGQAHVMTVTQVRTLIVQYGMAYQALWAAANAA